MIIGHARRPVASSRPSLAKSGFHCSNRWEMIGTNSKTRFRGLKPSIEQNIISPASKIRLCQGLISSPILQLLTIESFDRSSVQKIGDEISCICCPVSKARLINTTKPLLSVQKTDLESTNETFNSSNGVHPRS